MTRPTLDPVAWGTDATFTSGDRVGSAVKNTALSIARAAQGCIPGLGFPSAAVNHAINNFYQWLEFFRNERGQGFFGDGSSGDATVTGGTTTDTSQLYRGNLTVTSTGILVPSQYILFVNGTLTIEAGGQVHANGADAADGAGGAPPPDVPGGAGASGSSYLANGGIDGAEGSYETPGGDSNGDAASAGLDLGGYRSLGGAGGAGGASGGGATGGAGSPVTAPDWPIRHASFFLNQLREHLSASSATPRYYGGGGGGEGGISGISGVKGAGGGGGGLLIILARHVVNEGTISALGGNGGAAFSSNATGIGGGGGGGGGCVAVLSSEYSGAGSIRADGGTGGAATGTGSNGVDGSDGLALQLLI